MSAGGDSSHELALIRVAADAPGPEPTRVGLYHFAWEMESFDDLQALYNEMHEQDVKIGGLGDHGISMGVYFFDPDGNEIEAFIELPRDQWPEDRDLFAGSFPRKLEEPASVTG
jgi:catechol-2,3-dioxygenase